MVLVNLRTNTSKGQSGVDVLAYLCLGSTSRTRLAEFLPSRLSRLTPSLLYCRMHAQALCRRHTISAPRSLYELIAPRYCAALLHRLDSFFVLRQSSFSAVKTPCHEALAAADTSSNNRNHFKRSYKKKHVLPRSWVDTKPDRRMGSGPSSLRRLVHSARCQSPCLPRIVTPKP